MGRIYEELKREAKERIEHHELTGLDASIYENYFISASMQLQLRIAESMAQKYGFSHEEKLRWLGYTQSEYEEALRIARGDYEEEEDDDEQYT